MARGVSIHVSPPAAGGRLASDAAVNPAVGRAVLLLVRRAGALASG
jgi:hypothetical protein